MTRLPLRDITPPTSPGLYAPRRNIQPRQITGRYTRLRKAVGAMLVLLFFALPWLRWHGAPAFWLDLPVRQFHLLGTTYWPEDLGLLAGLLVVAALGLFWVTVLAGRVWCGYACPQTLWTAMFMWCERVTEGDRWQRLRLDRASASGRKLALRTAKHLLWGALSVSTALTLVALFVPMPVLLPGLFSGTVGATTWAWLAGIAVATCASAGWAREQVCVYVCPYARFQAVMFDQATPVVTYHSTRGEPRGHRQAASAPAGLGECVDCGLCVQVCPTGIDIRQGLQIACIACGACVDACKAIMTRLHPANVPEGLIAYGNEATQPIPGGFPRRPRLMAYGVMLLISAGLLGHAIATRPLLSFSVNKDRMLFRDRGDGQIENIYSLTLMNKAQQPHTYTLAAQGPAALAWHGTARLRLAPGEQRTEVIRLALPYEQATSQPLSFQVISDDPAQQLRAPGRFSGPLP